MVKPRTEVQSPPQGAKPHHGQHAETALTDTQLPPQFASQCFGVLLAEGSIIFRIVDGCLRAFKPSQMPAAAILAGLPVFCFSWGGAADIGRMDVIKSVLAVVCLKPAIARQQLQLVLIGDIV